MSLPLIFFLVLFFIIVVPFTVLIIILVIRGRNQAWTGTITNRSENTKRDFDTDRLETFYYVSVQIDGGREAKIAVDKGRYNEWKVGDKLEKKKGESWPSKLVSK